MVGVLTWTRLASGFRSEEVQAAAHVLVKAGTVGGDGSRLIHAHFVQRFIHREEDLSVK